MERRTTFTVGMFTLLMLATLSLVPASTPHDDPLAIEISVGGGKTLHMPVAAVTDSHYTFALVRVNESIAVKVVPVMRKGQVKFDVQLVSEGLERAETCEDKLKLSGERLGTYFGVVGQTTEIKRANLSIALKIVARRPNSERGARIIPSRNKVIAPLVIPVALQTGGCPCSECETTDYITKCCPNAGTCITCSTCGDVCCYKKKPGGGVELPDESSSN